MDVETLEAKQQAHQLLEQLGPGQVVAVLQLLEVMVDPSDDLLTEDDRRAVAASREYFRQHPNGGIPFEQVVSELGFSMAEIRGEEEG